MPLRDIVPTPSPRLTVPYPWQLMQMMRFVLDRFMDVSGTSGTGVVAEGVVFSDGTAVLRWRTDLHSTAIYDTVDDLMAVHGHEGATQLRWIDAPPEE